MKNEKNLVDSFVELSNNIKALEIDKKALNENFLAYHEKTGQDIFHGTENDLNISIPENCKFSIANLQKLCAEKYPIESNMTDSEKLIALQNVFELFSSLVKVDLQACKDSFGKNTIESFGKENGTPRILIKKHK